MQRCIRGGKATQKSRAAVTAKSGLGRSVVELEAGCRLGWARAITRSARVKESEGRPIHHTPAFWIGIALSLAAIAIYLWSDDLSWQPRSQ